MVYLFESNLPDKKSVIVALQHIYGIGKTTSLLLTKKLGILPNLKVQELSKEQLSRLIKIVENLNLVIVGDLKKQKLINYKNMVLKKSYRGIRRSQGLPVRGQRTHTNAKTARKRF